MNYAEIKVAIGLIKQLQVDEILTSSQAEQAIKTLNVKYADNRK